MKKNGLLLLFGLILSLGWANAQTQYPMSLVIEQQDASANQVIPIRSIGKITFESGKMKITHRNGWALPADGLYALSSITKCRFSTELPTTGTEQILATNLDFYCFEEGGSLVVTGLDASKTYALNIFDVSGSLFFRTDAYKVGQRIDVTTWPSGVYLLSINNKPIKFIKQ